MSSTRVWFTSDLHLGHRLVAGIRGHADTSAHDAEIVAEWISVVRPGDQVWVLGDLAASSPGYALGVLAGLPGEKFLISGNHDRCHPMFRDAHRRTAAYLEVFAAVMPFARKSIAGESVLLSHFPYSGDHTTEDRYSQYRLRDEGLTLLHGHTHSTGPVRHWTLNDALQIHVGWDAWRRLVGQDEIAQMLEEVRDAPEIAKEPPRAAGAQC